MTLIKKLKQIFYFSVLLGSFFLTTPSHATDETLKRLQYFLDDTQTLQGEFEQTIVSNGKTSQSSSGSLFYARSGKFRWQTEKPYAHLLVSDGIKIWLYDVDLAQVIEKEFKQVFDQSPLSLFEGKESLDNNFFVKKINNESGLEWFEIKPKSKESSFEKINIAFSDNTLKSMELFDHFGQTTIMHFSKMQRNGTIDPNLFKFTPPDGVELISD